MMQTVMSVRFLNTEGLNVRQHTDMARRVQASPVQLVTKKMVRNAALQPHCLSQCCVSLQLQPCFGSLLLTEAHLQTSWLLQARPGLEAWSRRLPVSTQGLPHTFRKLLMLYTRQLSAAPNESIPPSLT